MAKKSKNEEKFWSHKNDYPDEEVGETARVIARLIVPRLRAFRDYDNKHGLPPDFNSTREWDRAIEKMIYAFELYMYAPGPVTDQECKDFREGFDLFYKYYTVLWD